MPKRVLDTNVLINHWRDCLLKRRLHDVRTRDAQKWARELIDIHDSDAIVTPVYIEFVAGQGSRREMSLARAYLGEFEVIDEGHISDKDWERATEIAERVPRDGLRRQLGDCLIRAICDRLHYDIHTCEKRFPN